MFISYICACFTYLCILYVYLFRTLVHNIFVLFHVCQSVVRCVVPVDACGNASKAGAKAFGSSEATCWFVHNRRRAYDVKQALVGRHPNGCVYC